jgi:pilus assembly protein Flp/PilA
MLDMLQIRILQVIARFRRDETGAAMVEYGLLVGLIAIVVAAGAAILGQDISTMFSKIGAALVALPTTV